MSALFVNRQAELTFLNSARKNSDPLRPVTVSTVSSWHCTTSTRNGGCRHWPRESPSVAATSLPHARQLRAESLKRFNPW